jgi:hypothetical protein
MKAFVTDGKPPIHSSSGRHALWWRMALLLLLVTAFVLVLITFLNYANYRKTYLELNLTRYLVLGKDLRQTIETGLNNGLSPAENTRIRPAMSEAAEQQLGTRFIAIVDAAGAILSEGTVPADAAGEWQSRLSHTGADTFWHAQQSDTYQIGLPFTNSFNIKTGAVVIAYDRAMIERATTRMLYQLCLDMLKTFAVFAVFTLAGVHALTRRLHRELAAAGDKIDRTLAAVHQPQARIDSAVLGANITDQMNDFENLSRRVEQLIAELDIEHAAADRGTKA